MYRWYYCTTVVHCPGPIEQPEPGPIGPWCLQSVEPIRAVTLPDDGRQPYRVVAVATWWQAGEVEEDDKPSGCDVEAAGRT